MEARRSINPDDTASEPVQQSLSQLETSAEEVSDQKKENATASDMNGSAVRAEEGPGDQPTTESDLGLNTVSNAEEPLQTGAESRSAAAEGNDTVLPQLNGDEPMAMTSKGIAELDLDTGLGIQNAQHDVFDAHLGEDFPALPDLPFGDAETHMLSDTGATQIEDGPPRIRAFAKIEFEDGQYYINTYAVELGRDVRAAKRAQQRRFQREVAKRDRRRRGSDSSEDPTHGHRKYAPSSAVSESGGIVNFESLERRPRKKSKSKRSTSPSSSSFSRSRNNSIAEPVGPFDYQALAYERLLGSGAAGLDDPASYVPSRDDIPLIPVHPPSNEDQPGAGYGGISRRHAKIAYNFDHNCFEFETLGRNGGFVDEIWLGPGEVATLDHGSKIQIGGVIMIFLLPNRGLTGTENTVASEAVSAMSFEFEDGRGESMPVIDSSVSVSSEELPRDEGSVSPESDSDEDHKAGHGSSDDDSERSGEIQQSIEGDDGTMDGEGQKGHKSKSRKHGAQKKPLKAPKIKLKLKARQLLDESSAAEENHKLKTKPTTTQEKEKPAKPEHSTLEDIANKLGVSVDELPTRRKGPGRPPKDGIMSKREYAQLVRQQKERQKAEGLQNGTSKSGKTINGVANSGVPEKRKYTKRKKAEDEGDDIDGVRESIEGGEDGNEGSAPSVKPAKEKRPQKPPRSPSPVFDEATLTPEQLAKPAQSYVVLIHEALSNSPTGQMSLPQIYRAIERRYPFYKLRVTTQGWQSSVRHNLSQHAAFRKIEKDGKGWMWGLVPEVSIEKEKKRRPSPPSVPQQNFYPPGQNQPYRPNQYTYPAASSPSTSTPASTSITYPYVPPAQPYQATIPDVQRGYSGPLMPGHGAAPSTYQSPYTPAANAPTQPQPTASYPGAAPVTHSQIMNYPYYNAPTQSATNASSTPAFPPAKFSSPYRPAPSASKIFLTTRVGVPQPILDACTNFKSKLMEQLTSTPGIEQTIDKALNRVLTSILDGDNSTSTVDDPIEKIFADEARPVIEGIWRATQQSAQNPKTTISSSEPGPIDDEVKPEPQPAAEKEPTGIAPSSSSPGRSGPEPEQPVRNAESTSTSATPLEQHQQTPILNLLQQLAQSSSAATEPKAETETEAVSQAPPSEAATAPSQRSQVITASREAAEKAITALNVSTKRGYEEDEVAGERNDESNEQGKSDARPTKRMAVSGGHHGTASGS